MTTELMPQEQIQSNGPVDKLELGETLDLVASVGNHEAKALVILYLHNSGAYLTRHGMGRGFHDFIGEDTEWKFNVTQPFRYCEDSFEYLGQVVKGKVETKRGYSTAYALSERGNKEGLSLSGLLLRWSLDNPGISLQQVFGQTSTTGNIRASQSRVEVLSELLTSPDPYLSLVKISSSSPEEWRESSYHRTISNIDSAARALERSGIVRIEHVNDYNSRKFVIKDVEKPARSGPSMGDLNSIIYDFAKKQVKEGTSEFTCEECVQYVTTRVKEIDPSADEAKIRKKVTRNLGVSKQDNPARGPHYALPGIQRGETFSNGAHTRVYLNEDYRRPLESLLNILVGVEQKNEEVLKLGRDLAKNISEDSHAKTILMDKAKNSSPAANRRPLEQTSKEVQDLLGELNVPVGSREIGVYYEEKYGRPLGRATVRKVMRQLLSDDKIVTRRERVKSSIEQQHNIYSIKRP